MNCLGKCTGELLPVDLRWDYEPEDNNGVMVVSSMNFPEFGNSKGFVRPDTEQRTNLYNLHNRGTLQFHGKGKNSWVV